MYETTDSDDDRTNYETTGDVIRAILSALDEGDAAEVNVGHATHRVETGADVWDDEEQTEVRLTNEEIPTWAGIAPVDVEDVQPVTDDEDDDEDEDLWTEEFAHSPASGIHTPAHVPENLRDELERVFSEIEELVDGRRRTENAGTVRFEFDREASEWTFHSVEIRDYARRTAYSNDDVQTRAEQAIAAVQSYEDDDVRADGGDEDDEEDPFHPDDLDAKHVQPYGVRITTPDGEEFEFEVPETFRGMNLNDLLELYRERVAMDGVDDLEPGRWYAEQVEEDHGVNPDDEDGPVVLPDGGQILPEDDDEGYPADPSRDETTVHGVQENTSGIVGLCVLYSVHGLHYRVRLRPVNPLDSETFDRGDAWTMFEWAEVETPDEDAPSVSFEEIHVVPAVVREVFPGPVQVPDEPGHVGGSR